jgi:hypothetical protein
MAESALPSVEYEGVHCTLAIRRPVPGIAVIVISGSDVGEFADAPMRELDKDLAQSGSIELFIDARAVRGASISVSSEWALWMNNHRLQLAQIHMLTGSRYVQMTADFVRRFVGLIDRMKLYTDPAAFDETLAERVRLVQVA